MYLIKLYHYFIYKIHYGSNYGSIVMLYRVLIPPTKLFYSLFFSKEHLDKTYNEINDLWGNKKNGLSTLVADIITAITVAQILIALLSLIYIYIFDKSFEYVMLYVSVLIILSHYICQKFIYGNNKHEVYFKKFEEIKRFYKTILYFLVPILFILILIISFKIFFVMVDKEVS